MMQPTDIRATVRRKDGSVYSEHFYRRVEVISNSVEDDAVFFYHDEHGLLKCFGHEIPFSGYTLELEAV